MSHIIDIPFRRGYSAIALVNAKNRLNIGAALRAAWVFQTKLVLYTGPRYHHAVTDTMKSYKNLPLIHTENIFNALPYDCIPIAVDILPNSIPLPNFNHPDRACYIFGPEDGTLGATITDRCKYTLTIPAQACLNLAAAINVVLYDREAKHYNKRLNTDLPLAALSLGA